MSKIDLSKAKIGDKFRTKGGQILKYNGKDNSSHFDDNYQLIDETHSVFHYHKKGNFLLYRESDYDLIEQVFDESLDTKERDIRTNDEMRKVVEIADEEKQELQRRQEVIALAEKLVVNEEMMKAHKDLFEAKVYAHAKTQTTYPAFVIRFAEDFIKYKNQYLKEGKLC